MRYIDLNLIDQCKPENWDVKSQRWARKIQAATNKSAELKKIGNKWRDFKPKFDSVFGEKCWYSEVPLIGTDFDVDHFRPKGDVKISERSYASRQLNGISQNHEGYWWLAFEAKNYRYSCIESNRPRGKGGKHDYFPLVDETTRVWTSCNFADHDEEKPKLLDPCSQTDVRLISYEMSTGEVASRPFKDSDAEDLSRVQESIKRYNLNSKTIKGARSEVIKKVMRLLEVIEHFRKYSPASASKEQIETNSILAKIEQDVVDACSRKSAFSAAAVAFVRQKRHEPWLAHLLPKLDLSD